jgi:hypothetical protein
MAILDSKNLKLCCFHQGCKTHQVRWILPGTVAPPGALIAVQGDLKVEFPSLFVFGNRTEERTKFYIYMVDRKGNKSNELITPEVGH